jgi:hypothetical protein
MRLIVISSLLRLGWCGLGLAVSRLWRRNAIGFVSKLYSFFVSFSVSLLLVAVTIGKKIDHRPPRRSLSAAARSFHANSVSDFAG